MDTDQYIEVFLDESREHLQAVNDNLLILEKQPEEINIVNGIFRSAHTLKGMAATMGFEDIASLTHKMENVLDKIRNHELAVTTEVIDITFLAIEAMEEMVNEISAGNDGKKDVTDLVSRLEQMEEGRVVSEMSENTVDEKPLQQMELDIYQNTVISQAVEQGYKAYHVTIKLAEDCILKAARAYMVVESLESKGEIIHASPSIEELENENFNLDFSFVYVSKEPSTVIETEINKISEINNVVFTMYSATIKKSDEEIDTPESSTNETKAAKTKSNTSKTIRVNLERIDDLMNLFEELVIDRGRLENISQKAGNHDLLDAVEHMSRVSEEMQGLLLTMRMVAIEQVFNRFPRMVRGLAKDLNKKIELEVLGAETELDRTVIDEIGDPLVHLIRNSIDHGIEVPEVRKNAGKSEVGQLTLEAYHSGNHVFIEIEDDGAGINRDRVEAKAIENGLISAEESKLLSDNEIHQFILSSGFSTADEISDISGRGVGLDVVKNKIESLGGQIYIESEKGIGSKFTIELPLTLSILSTLLVDIKNEIYAIPMSSIIETAQLDKEQIMYAHGQKVIDYRGKIIPLVSVKKVFNIPGDADLTEQRAVVVVKKGEKLAGLIVDSFLGQKEIVLKSLGDFLGDVFAISGATILGDGRVSLIIDPNALIK